MQSSQKVIIWVIVAVVVIAVIGGIVYVLNRSPSEPAATNNPSTTPAPTTTTATTALTLQDINNATYSINGTADQFSNGSFQGNGITASISSSALGDVNGDGLGDAAVVLQYSKNGSSVQTNALDIVTDSNGSPSVFNISIPSEPGENLATGFSVVGIDNTGTITLQLDFANGTSQTRQYKYQNGQLIQTNSPSATNTGMQQYIDSAFGFSFWYPKNWSVEKEDSAAYSEGFAGGINLQGDEKFVGGLIIGPVDTANAIMPTLSIEEITSPTYTVYATDSNEKVFYDIPTHTWMTSSEDEYGNPTAAVAADVSLNTMGGLHMIGTSNTLNGEQVIPLNAQDFLIIENVGGIDAVGITNTILALDPAVATPVSATAQQTTIQQTQSILAAESVVTWKTYADTQHGFSFKYPVLGGYFGSVLNSPNVILTPANEANSPVDTNGCYTAIDSARPISSSSEEKHLALGDNTFCESSGGDPGAGSIDNSDYYTTLENNNYITIGFKYGTSDCGVIDGDPGYIGCVYYNQGITQPIQQSVSTLQFTK